MLEEEQVLFAVIMGVFGLLIGSFLNVCIYRIPKKESIVYVPSHCMSCSTKLHWYELIPLFSWLALRGRCRTCKAKISPQYPIIEAFNSILYIAIVLVNGWSLTSVLYCLLGSCLIVLSVIDFRTYEIPIGINIFILCLGAIETIHDFEHVWIHLAGLIVVSLPMFLFVSVYYYFKQVEAFGGGDIKLLAAAGLLIGWKNILLAFVIGCIVGSVMHLVRMKFSGEDHVLAMGPYLAIGILISALWGETMIGWYVNLL